MSRTRTTEGIGGLHRRAGCQPASRTAGWQLLRSLRSALRRPTRGARDLAAGGALRPGALAARSARSARPTRSTRAARAARTARATGTARAARALPAGAGLTLALVLLGVLRALLAVLGHGRLAQAGTLPLGEQHP